MKWLVADMRELAGLDDGSFDLVIDKAAVDALQCDEGSPWDPNPAVLEDVARTCEQVLRVLRPGGTFVSISFQQPHFRKRYFVKEEYGWSLETRNIGEGGSGEAGAARLCAR